MPRMRKFVSVLFALALGANAQALSPTKPGQHMSSESDSRLIQSVLSHYTQAVSTGDENGFRALLLSEDIPFSAIDPLVSPKAGAVPNIRRYAEFRDSIFRSGMHFTQTFDHIRTEQDNELASVTLDFVTRSPDGSGGGFGFKVLHLLKVKGEWKIASEFYTAYPLPEAR